MPSLQALATLKPPSSSRTWQSAPHPSLPILATACSDKTVRLYSLSTFEKLTAIGGGHKRSIRSVAWKPGSGPSGGAQRKGGVPGIGQSVLATGSFDASAGIWRRWEQGSSAMVDAEGEMEIDMNGSGQQGEDDDGEDEWNFAVVLDGHDSEIKSVAFSSTSPLLATCSRDKSVWIWEELEDDNFETVAVLQEHEGDVKCVAWHPDEELLASASYDDTVRLWREDVDDWACCACLRGHEGTVWWVEFEGVERAGLKIDQEDGEQQERKQVLEVREAAGPRLATCSDDTTIRLWRRIPKEKSEAPVAQKKMPSIIKTDSIEEDWIEESRLPTAHDRAVYSVAWSRKSGRIASTGSDGKLVVYEERWTQSAGQDQANGHDKDSEMHDAGSTDATQWVVIAEYENAHDVFEINHVCWATRFDKGRASDDEEMLVTTGDDGEVKTWSLG